MRVRNERVAAVAAGAAIVVGIGSVTAVAADFVTSRDIKNDTIRSVDVRDNTLTRADISDRAERSLRGQRGPQGEPGPRGRAGESAVERVTSLDGEFTATNASVSMTSDGVEFGPYADGGAAGGSVQFAGLNGETVADIDSLVYYARYTAQGDTGGVGVPYLRVFTDNGAGGENSIIFSPNTQGPDPDIDEGPFHEWVATSGTWRYNDDAGTGPDTSWQQIVADHGDEEITGIYISTGFSNGTELSSLLRWWQVNDQVFAFGG